MVGLLVSIFCNLVILKHIVANALETSIPVSDIITLQYQVDQGLPLMKLDNDSVIKFYMELKKWYSTLTRFPLRITKNVDSMCEHHVSTSMNQDSFTNWCNRKHYKYTSTMKTTLFYYDFHVNYYTYGKSF